MVLMVWILLTTKSQLNIPKKSLNLWTKSSRMLKIIQHSFAKFTQSISSFRYASCSCDQANFISTRNNTLQTISISNTWICASVVTHTHRLHSRIFDFLRPNSIIDSENPPFHANKMSLVKHLRLMISKHSLSMNDLLICLFIFLFMYWTLTSLTEYI